MPFTPAHVAAVLPLHRRPWSFAAAACGAVAPDLPFYLQVVLDTPLRGRHTHTLPGALLVDVPVALVLYALLRLAAPAWTRLLGTPMRRRVAPYARPLTWDRWVVVSAIAGVLTHVVWDHFTHAYGFVVQRVAFLRADAAGGLTVHEWLQQLSTLIGLSILTYALVRWYRSAPEATEPPGASGRERLGVAAAAALASALLAVAHVTAAPGAGTRQAATRAVEGVVAGSCLVLLAYGLLLRAQLGRRDDAENRPA